MRYRNKPLRPPERLSNQSTPPAGVAPPSNALAPPSDRTAIYTLAGVIVAATIAFISSQWVARTTFDAQMAQIGVSILSADPAKSDIAPAREWAIKLVETHSGQEFSAQDRGSLLHHPIQTQTLPFVAGSPFSGAPCSAFHRSPDGSLTVVKLDVGNVVHFDFENDVKNTGETKLLDLFCGQH